MLAEDDYSAFCAFVENQSLRHLRRYLDYGKRVRNGEGLRELQQWLGRILLDQDNIYGLEDKASAFEIGACEWLAVHWDELNHPDADPVTIAGPVDKVLLVRLIASQTAGPQRAALAQLFRERYGRTWSWVGERATQLESVDVIEGQSSTELFTRFLEHLDNFVPISNGPSSAEIETQLEQAQEREERLRREVAATTHRAERAATRVEGLQQELSQARRSTREEGELSERLREERSRRIKLERQARDGAQELERLKSEYLKLDSRLRESAHREGGLPMGELVEIAQLAQLDPQKLLGLSAGATPEEVAQARRRFAAAFHSDRTSQLPDWVGELFDQLLGAVNAACDRSHRL